MQQLKQGLIFDSLEPKIDEKIEKPIFNTNFFTEDKSTINLGEPIIDTTPKRKVGRPKKENLNTVVTAEGNESSRELTMMEKNTPYIETYQETTNMLKGSIGQIDMLHNELSSDLETVRNSKTLKKKYDYISMLGSTMGTLIGSKVTAIREINSTITKAHDLDMKRMKELKINEVAKDDDKTIMDMYKAFISTPVGSYTGNTVPLPTAVDITSMNNMDRIGMVNDQSSYDAGINNVAPQVNMMLLGTNPDIKTVFVMDDKTGGKWFDVINVKTGESIPGADKPDPMFIDNIVIDRHNRIAKDKNLNITYDLIIMNEDTRYSAF